MLPPFAFRSQKEMKAKASKGGKRVPKPKTKKVEVKAPDVWLPHYRLNVCVQDDCGHYLFAHSDTGRCLAAGCKCTQPVGRVGDASS